jgi:hypothetical protein
MSIPFPEIKPSGRSFKPGQFPTKVYRALSGATVKRSFGNRAFGNELRLEFRAISDNLVNQFLDHYNATGGGFTRFVLSAAALAGLSTTTQGYLQSTATIRWEYAGPPEITSLRPGCSDVQITLVGELINV